MAAFRTSAIKQKKTENVAIAIHY